MHFWLPQQHDKGIKLEPSVATTREYQEKMVMVIKTFQMQNLDSAGTSETAKRLLELTLQDPITIMYELFRLLMKNAPLWPKFMAVFNECRLFFEMKMTEDLNDEENPEILCSIYVLRKMCHKITEGGSLADLKAFSTLLRQLSRSVVKLSDGKQVFDQVAFIPTTCIITELLFNMPLTKSSAEFILILLNHIFGTGKETHVFVIQWKKTEDEPYLLPRELFCYLLVVYRYLKSVDSTKTTLPFAFRTFGVKLQNERVRIEDAAVVVGLLNELPWSEKFALVKWLGSAASQEMKLEVPESLHRMLRHDRKRNYQSIPTTTLKDESSMFDFFDSMFELAVASADLACEFLDEMLSPLFVMEVSAEELRAHVHCALIRQIRKHMDADNFRSILQLLEVMLKRLNWPLDLIVDLGERPTVLINEIALKNELLLSFGLASFVEVSSQVTNQTAEPSTSSAALANCFATESNRVISDMMTRFVSDQTVSRSKKAMIPAEVLKALSMICNNVQLIVEKMLKTPLDSAQLGNLNNRLTGFQKQIQLVVPT
ncbi:hypothetical protein M3Y97_01004000 [Aphelenchoides bicaudatus]|nr:hypothetical protein M3Y97_01004000 [Aphelenchoides bicaudatus]